MSSPFGASSLVSSAIASSLVSSAIASSLVSSAIAYIPGVFGDRVILNFSCFPSALSGHLPQFRHPDHRFLKSARRRPSRSSLIRRISAVILNAWQDTQTTERHTAAHWDLWPTAR